ncbi:MAG: HlyD family efflux transporter periplasmic adaptor subunit [Planctomycetia bacterium]|nr:HlyD family efflux transporter periplasmic adaptor subunit [Planctomycetia bacterium]
MQRRSTSSRSPVSWPALLAAAGSWGLSLATASALAAVGWFGHSTHWTFGIGGHAGYEGHASSPVHAAPAADASAAAPGEVRFRSQEAVERTGIEIVPVEKRPMVSELVVNGVVAYDERRIAQLSTRVPGSIWRVEKHLGDHVRKGDVLLVIDSQDVGQLKADFLNALVVFESRREQLAILEEVKGAVMGRQLREARAAVREARNHLVNAEQSLVNLGFDVSVTDYEPLDDDARAARLRTVGLPPPLVAGLDPTRITSNLLPLYAPFDGVVVGREAVVGEVIEAAKPIFEVADVSTMLLVLNVSKEDAGKVAIGQPVRFRPDGSDEEYESRITWISTEVNEETRTLQVRAEVANDVRRLASASAGLRANTYGSGRIEIERRGTAVVVPLESVQWDGSRWVVFVPAGDMAFAARAVEPGVRDGPLVEIVDVVADGTPLTRVVAAGSHVLKSQVLLERMERGEL